MAEIPVDSEEREKVKATLENVKNRIITTGKLFKSLSSARDDVQEKTRQISELQKSLSESLKATDSSNLKFFELETKYNELKNSQKGGDPVELTKKLRISQQKIAALTQEKIKLDSVTQSRDLYVQQLEAKCEVLKNDTSHKPQNNSAEIKKLQQSLKKKEEEISEIKAELEEERNTNEKTDDSLMELQVDHSMLKTNHEELQVELKASEEKCITYEKEISKLNALQQELNIKLHEANEKISKAKERIEKAEERAVRAEERASKAEERASKAEEKAARARSTNLSGLSSFAGTESSTEYNILNQKYRCVKADLQMIKSYNAHLQQQMRDMLIKQENTSDEETDSGFTSSRTVQLLPSSISADSFPKTPSPTSPVGAFSPTIPEPIKNQTSVQDHVSKQLNRTAPTSPPPLSSNMLPQSNNHSNSSIHIPQKQKQSSLSKPQASLTQKHDNHSAAVSNQALPIPQKFKRSSLSGALSSGQPIPNQSTDNVSLKRKRQDPLQPTSDHTDKASYRTSGLIPPPPAVASVRAPPKPKVSKLEKFVNSRNPSKLIGSKPTSLLKKKPEPTTETSEALVSKKAKVDNKYLRIAEQSVLSKCVPTTVNLHEELDSVLLEIEACFEKIRSVANPTDESCTDFGIPDGIVVHIPEAMDKREALYAWLLRSLTYNDKDLHERTSQSIANTIIKRCMVAKPQSILMRYTRTVAILCRESNDIQRMQTLCFDIIQYSKCAMNTINCLLNIACIYSDSLKAVSPDFAVGTQIICNTMGSVVKQVASSFTSQSQKEHINTAYSRITALFGWSSFESVPTLETAIDFIAGVLNNPNFEEDYSCEKGNYDHIRFCIVKSSELLFYRLNNWNLMYDSFIRNTLWPLLSAKKAGNICLELFGVLGSLGLATNPEGKDKAGAQVLLDTLSEILELSPEEETIELQVTAVNGIILLGKNKPEYLKMAKDWISKNQEKTN